MVIIRNKPLVSENLRRTRYMSGPLVKSMILSNDPADPVKRTTATIVRPPLVSIFQVHGPASRYCSFERTKVTWPLPCGPPSGLYKGGMTLLFGSNGEGRGALPRVALDANLGSPPSFGSSTSGSSTSARNRAHVLLLPDSTVPHTVTHEVFVCEASIPAIGKNMEQELDKI